MLKLHQWIYDLRHYDLRHLLRRRITRKLSLNHRTLSGFLARLPVSWGFRLKRIRKTARLPRPQGGEAEHLEE